MTDQVAPRSDSTEEQADPIAELIHKLKTTENWRGGGLELVILAREAADALARLAREREASDRLVEILRKLVSGYCDAHISIPVEDSCPACDLATARREREEARRKGIREAAAWIDALGRDAEKRSEKWRLSNEHRHAEVSGFVATELGLAATGLRKLADEGGIP